MQVLIRPSEEQIDQWIKLYVPDKDLFYLQNKDLIDLKDELNEVLVIPQKEFFKHASYQQIQLSNSYEYWERSEAVEFVIVAHPDWVTKLPADKKKHLFEAQVKMGRGLILSHTLFPSIEEIPEEHIVGDNEDKRVVFQRAMWDLLSYQLKAHILREYAKEWETWSSQGIPEHAPHHLKSVANTFPMLGGSNCLSTVLFAMTGEAWILDEWVHPQTFESGLEHARYLKTQDPLCEGDVVTWEDSNGVIQHASYHIGDHLFFNKNGQTFFNPWKIVSLTDLSEGWGHLCMTVYRRS